jgi:hypothetical protein
MEVKIANLKLNFNFFKFQIVFEVQAASRM